MSEPRVNAVITARIPLDIPVDSSKEEKLQAACDKVDSIDLYLEDGFEVTFEDVDDGGSIS